MLTQQMIVGTYLLLALVEVYPTEGRVDAVS